MNFPLVVSSFKFQLNAAQSFFCSSGNGYRVEVVIISSERCDRMLVPHMILNR